MLSTGTCGVLKVLSKKQLTLDHVLSEEGYDACLLDTYLRLWLCGTHC